MEILYYIIILIFSVMVHEVSHGAIALKFGDTTAKDAGRLTLNPIKHIDPFGSIILPLLMILPSVLSGRPIGPIFGWAKPVPVNPYNLKNPKKEYGLVGLAGPLSNFLLALIFALIFRLSSVIGINSTPLLNSFLLIVMVNIGLAVFNLIPIPPLDGSSILFSFLRDDSPLKLFLSRYGFIILLVLIFSNSINFISLIISILFSLFTGLKM
ncbi:MAG: site-2 protease family protein [Candidatus Pacebacteria bacterium]|nr:site-2 protease family protein [Candidatus Paceibacterota bacterium]